ncbi:uncharacterized protein LOC122498337 [Leptopilina heterotoma]|uniref:uncharacterized protein LOC122498337 n=1 Tax=Leptopilina heterotoma TaxID=63436 RepID=UPI001CAA1F9D|nr:uncharacterized protein LOC122498337 [Leptopilina heterotoma]
MVITDTPLDAWDKVSLDTVGKLPTTANENYHILTMQDQLSEYCIFVSIQDKNATTIANAIATNLISVYGAPKCLLIDQGRSFTNKDGYVHVYTDGACKANGKPNAQAGIGIWFNQEHPLNISDKACNR